MRFLVYINWTADSNLQAGDTAAHIAASRGDIKIVEALHDAGANLHLYSNVSKPFRFCSNERFLQPLRAQAGFRPSEVARRKGYLEVSQRVVLLMRRGPATPPSSEGDSV